MRARHLPSANPAGALAGALPVLVALALALALAACGDNSGSGDSNADSDGADGTSNDGDGDRAGDGASNGDSDGPGDADGGDGARPGDSDSSGTEPARYPTDRSHSPINAYVRERMAAIRGTAPGANDDVFMKAGDSITISSAFLDCFADPGVTVSPELAETHAYFLAGDAAGSTPYDRQSAASMGGKTADWCVSGTDPPLQLEIDALSPSIAVVMFGTNDIGYNLSDFPLTLRWYGENMFLLVDALIAAGVVPILSSIPPLDTGGVDAPWVRTMNAAVRGLAQGRQVPFMDYHRELLPVPDYGLAPDGVHPDTNNGDACDFSPVGLTHGYNVRNLLTLEALDRVRRALHDPAFVPDDAPGPPPGDGSPDDPIEVDVLPFTTIRTTSGWPHANLDSYPTCDAGQNESGPEHIYRLTTDRVLHLRAFVVTVTPVDIDIHRLGDPTDPTSCTSRHHSMLQGTLQPGTHYFVADTYVSNDGTVREGEYLFGVVECDPGDPACVPPL